jgi:hypothetical protein
VFARGKEVGAGGVGLVMVFSAATRAVLDLGGEEEEGVDPLVVCNCVNMPRSCTGCKVPVELFSSSRA